MRRYKNIALKLFVVAALIAWLLSACATVSTDNPDAALVDARNSLMVADVVYSELWPAFLDAHTRGLVSNVQFKLGMTAADAYSFAWTEATNACELYMDNRDEDARKQAIVALMEASRLIGELLGYLKAFTGSEVK